MTNGIYIFNQVYFIASLFVAAVCLWFFSRLKNHFGLKFALSLLGGSLLSLLASGLPWLAFVLTIAFVPSFIYHMIDPLVLAPLVIGLIGFMAAWVVLTLIRELAGLLSSGIPTRWNVTITTSVVFIFMCLALRSGISGYKIVFHAQQISRYAPTGNDPQRLKDIYLEAAQSHDTRMFTDVISLLALNHNLSSAMLNEIYTKTAQSDLNSISRDRIYRTLTKNPNTSAELFRKLMFALSQTQTLSASSATINYIPQEHNFSEHTILELSVYPDCEIRRAIIAYPNISQEVLVKMVKDDPDLGIRHDARKRLEFIHGVNHLENNTESPLTNAEASPVSTDAILSTDNESQLHKIFNDTADSNEAGLILEGLANNCYINADLARKLYSKALNFRNYSRTAILKALASNPKTPVDVLSRLAMEKDLVILRQLVSNPNLPLPLIVKLSPYPDCKIRKKIMCIPGVTTSVLKKLRRDTDESVAVEASERLSQEEEYLQNCVEIKKLNSSCQKYYSTKSPDMRIYPNTSERKPLLSEKASMFD